MEAILFALVAHVGWATSDIFGAMVSRKIGGYSLTFWSYVIRIPVLALYLPFDLVNLSALTPRNFFISALLAVVLLFGTSCFFEAFRAANASLVGTVGAAFVVPTVILSVLFFGERLSSAQILTISVIVVGLVMTSLDFRTLRQRGVILERGVGLALIAMLCWGIYYAFIRLPVEEIGWFLPAYIGFLVSPIVLVLMKVQKVTLESPLRGGVLPAFVAAVILGAAANFGYNLGISSGYTSIVAPIAGAYPILFVCLSAWVFKDRLQRYQLWGIIISLIGIVTLSLLA